MSVIVDLSNLKRYTINIERLSRVDSMRVIGERVRQLNESQIKNNKDANGSTFDKYNKQYANKYKKGNRQPITFVRKNRMMTSFGVIKAKVGSAEIGFHGTFEKQKAAWNYNLRKFIGLTDKNLSRLKRWILTAYVRKK